MAIKYTCNATLCDLKKHVFEFELVKSCAFEYGNGTALIVRPDDERERLYDTRYVSDLSLDMDADDFIYWCDDWFTENYSVIAISAVSVEITYE